MRLQQLASMLALAVAAWLALLPASALAQAYGQYDIRQLLTPSPTAGQGGSLNGAYLDRMLQDLSAHAANYPPRFDSPQDQQRAQRDAGTLMGLLQSAFGSQSAAPELELRMGMLGAIAHNLQLPQGAGFAQTHFSRLLAARPDDAWGNYHYGQFLAGTGRGREALPALGKARDKGVTPALYALGLVHLTLGDKPKALALLTEYQKAVPADQNVGRLLQGIRDGKVEVRTVGASR